jgi:hypothetical protein
VICFQIFDTNLVLSQLQPNTAYFLACCDLLSDF